MTVIIDAQFEEVTTPAPSQHQTVADTTDRHIYQCAINKQKDEVVAALAQLLSWRQHRVERIIKARRPKCITALCWKAGLSAATAFQIQLHIQGISAQQAVPPGEKGYSLPTETLQWYMEFVEDF